MEPAPIALFVYNRPAHTRRTLEALKANILADRSILYIFADGPRVGASEEQLSLIAQVRTLIIEEDWCGQVIIHHSETNQGLADNIVSGVSQVLEVHGRIIVIEDDIMTSPGFLMWMNQALEAYQEDDRFMHISGYMLPVPDPLPDTIITTLTYCWGWATWARAWRHLRTDSKELYKEVQVSKGFNAFNYGATYDFTSQLKDNVDEVRKTWAVRWYATCFLRGGMVVQSGRSLTSNIGFDGSGESQSEENVYTAEELPDRLELLRLPPVETVEARETLQLFYRMLYFVPDANKKEPGLGVMIRYQIIMVLKTRLRQIIRWAYTPEEVEKDINSMRIARAYENIFYGEGTTFYTNSRVENLYFDKTRLRIGANCHIHGRLMVLPYGGKMKIGNYVFIGERSEVWSANSISIGDYTLISYNVSIIDTNSHERAYEKRAETWRNLPIKGYPKRPGQIETAPIVIEDHVWINFNATILKGVRIGRGAIVAAHSVVTKDVPPFAFVAGAPAEVKFYLDEKGRKLGMMSPDDAMNALEELEPNGFGSSSRWPSNGGGGPLA